MTALRLGLALTFLRVTWGPVFEQWEPRNWHAKPLFHQRLEAAEEAAEEIFGTGSWQQIQWMVGLLGPLILLLTVPPHLSRAAEKVYKRHANIDTAKPSSQHFARRSRAARALRHADEPPPLW